LGDDALKDPWPLQEEEDVVDDPQFIPGIPDELSLGILARLPRSCHFSLRLVCKRWKRAFSSHSLFSLRKELLLTEEWLYLLIRRSDESLAWHAVDPSTGMWHKLPPMPDMACGGDDLDPSSSSSASSPAATSSAHTWLAFVFKEFMRALFGHRESAEKAAFYGCAAGSIDGCLYILGGFTKTSATRSVWLYDPCANAWKEAASMGCARAYCKTAFVCGKLYAVGGVNRGRAGLTPLQSAEVYDPSANIWTSIPDMPFSKAQLLPAAFPADMLKPIATGMAAYRDRLFVPQSLYSWPFFVDVGGEVFDPMAGMWSEMPRGMGEGWPAKQAGTKLSAVVNGHLYALEPTGSLDGCKVKVYDSEADSWKIVLKKVPILLDFSESESPYLLAGFKNKLRILTKDINDCVVVLGADIDSEVAPVTNPSGNGTASETEADRWKTVAKKHFGSVELVACQVLEI
jgi:hypothetical protein